MKHKKKNYTTNFKNVLGMAIGGLLAAISIRIFLYPNQLIDGGVIGISLIFGRLFGDSLLSLFLIIFNIPFIILAYKYIRKTFVLNMLIATILFAGFLIYFEHFQPFKGEILEIIVFGGALLGTGVGLIIKNGGCTDGTEILAIIVNRRFGFTVGQIVLIANIFIFAAYGWIFKDWHIALQSLMAYVVAFKMIDIVIAGLDEVKSVIILTSKPKKVKNLIMHELGLGLTIIPGIGGFSKENREILYVIVERLDLSELKEIVLQEDPYAFMAIENLHEVAYGKHLTKVSQKKKRIDKKRKNRLFN